MSKKIVLEFSDDKITEIIQGNINTNKILSYVLITLLIITLIVMVFTKQYFLGILTILLVTFTLTLIFLDLKKLNNTLELVKSGEYTLSYEGFESDGRDLVTLTFKVKPKE